MSKRHVICIDDSGDEKTAKKIATGEPGGLPAGWHACAEIKKGEKPRIFSTQILKTQYHLVSSLCSVDGKRTRSILVIDTRSGIFQKLLSLDINDPDYGGRDQLLVDAASSHQESLPLGLGVVIMCNCEFLHIACSSEGQWSLKAWRDFTGKCAAFQHNPNGFSLVTVEANNHKGPVETIYRIRCPCDALVAFIRYGNEHPLPDGTRGRHPLFESNAARCVAGYLNAWFAHEHVMLCLSSGRPRVSKCTQPQREPTD